MEPSRKKQRWSVEAGAGKSEHRKRKRRESLSSPALEQPAANGVYATNGTPGMTVCLHPAWCLAGKSQLLGSPCSPSEHWCAVPGVCWSPQLPGGARLPDPCPWLTCPQAHVPLMRESCLVVPWMRVCSSSDVWRWTPQGLKIYPQLLPAQGRPQCTQTPSVPNIGILLIPTVSPGVRPALEME